MKLKKLKLNELSNTDLNEREMVRLLGGGTPGCCQCGCNYAGEPGGSSTASNDSANNAKGYTSDPGAQPCCDDDIYGGTGGYPIPVDNICNHASWSCPQYPPLPQFSCG